MVVAPNANLVCAADAPIGAACGLAGERSIARSVPMASHSFGGWKASLFGDHDICGEERARFHMRHKIIMQRWPGVESKGPEFAMPVNE